MKLMKLKLQDPLLARAPSKAPGGALATPLKYPEIKLVHKRKKLDRGVYKFDNDPKIFYHLPVKSFED